MKYRPSGKTGLNVSGLNFGASSLGGVFHHVDETEAIRAMPAALVPLNIDGYNLGSDWYLRLADQAGKMLRGEISVRSTIPITPP